MPKFNEVPPTFDLRSIEDNILKFWKKTNAFKKRSAMNRGGPNWSFIDGPITANNPMGVHHAWGRTYKDLYQRYKAMRGFNLRYQNGFDCQGLWVEVEVEKELGFKSKRDIEEFGIAKFVNKCKERVLRYSAIQVEQSIRLGYWMDWDDVDLLRKLANYMDRPDEVLTVKGTEGVLTETVERIVGKLGGSELGGSYFTFSTENNYTIWMILKKCHGRGWVYKGRDVMPWCPRCSTAISQHEIATEGYRELTHPGLTIKFPLHNRPNEYLLVWTTTPWTLTANIAVAVHPNMIYVKVYWNGESLYVGKTSTDRIFPSKFQILKTLKGREMVGWTYDGPFDELPSEQKAGAKEGHRILLWEEVTETEGTGIVHIAPGCGKEDFELSKEYQLPIVAPLDEYGVFLDGFDQLSGTHVYDSATAIIDILRRKGLLFKVENYVHRYPVCWRCGNELIFRLVDEWFISMGEKLNRPLETITEREVENSLRYQIIETAKSVRWIPSFGLLQEVDWLLNMEDWMISKKRYWGLALPIWECGGCGSFDVIGGEEELKARAIEGWESFEGHTPHRPWIDAVKIDCPKCGSIMSRIKDVGNPWLDAGIVAYSTLNYRHDRDYWKKWFPADMICESLAGQFRNWFYSMLTMSTILERKTPFLTCLGTGLVLAEDGREMHKSWGNAIWFDDAVEDMGADVMRWMYCTNKPETNLLFGYKGVDLVKKQFLIPLRNVYSFFVTYANLDEWTPKDTTDRLSLLDRWILSKLQVLIQKVTNSLEEFDTFNATKTIQQFVDGLSTWYIRRTRRRFWKSDSDEDKKAAYTTLYGCLTNLIKILAPFLPFIAEEMYQNLVRRIEEDVFESVHQNNWPIVDPSQIDQELMDDMEIVLKVSSLGHSIRNKSGIKLRQSLAEVRIVVEDSVSNRLERFKGLLREELNVKTVTMSAQEEDLVNYKIRLLPNILGKKYGSLFPKIGAAVTSKDAKELASSFRQGVSVNLDVEGRVVTLLPEEVEVATEAKEGWATTKDEGLTVGLNIIISEGLKVEGLARDIVRRIQNQRKEAGYKIADEIETYYDSGPKLVKVFESYGDYIAAETLSKHVYKVDPPKNAFVRVYELDGEKLRIGLIQV